MNTQKQEEKNLEHGSILVVFNFLLKHRLCFSLFQGSTFVPFHFWDAQVVLLTGAHDVLLAKENLCFWQKHRLCLLWKHMLVLFPFLRSTSQKDMLCLLRESIASRIRKTRQKLKGRKKTQLKHEHAYRKEKKNPKSIGNAQHATRGRGWTHHLACSQAKKKSNACQTALRCNL